MSTPLSPPSISRNSAVCSGKSTRTIAIGPGLIEIHLTGAQSGGQLDVLVFNAPPGMPGPAPHRHPHADETFHVLEGQVEFALGEQSFRADAGTTVHVPRGVVHAFRYVGTSTVRMLVTMTPSQHMAEYFERVAAILRTSPLPLDAAAKNRLAALMLEFGHQPA